ncbi:cell division protein FtsQ/DivIB [Alkaliphilus peptidifermentans]|uniref:Cell division protein FtsQ n=1 Tax=Alkaliphilus peptidifermentans DSM 18978 TaxID=1120976 RepID=A0A1G5BDT7_9FIRM|nr:FtsQ-type POTRA domain-containing protein [Alkaliphilus peptidifermentans]SCX88328.1 cell division protein FtsQ [Alkaliphilus peptidifermentans DSM 18978]
MGAQERQKRKKIRRKLRGFFSLMLILVVFLLWGIYGILQSDFMNLKVVDVEGNITLTSEEVLEASQLLLQRNILKYNLQDIQENIETHPYIKTAEIERKLPNRLIINVKERKEYAIIAYMGSYLYIDNEGVVLKISDSYFSNQIPLITGLSLESFELGGDIVSSNTIGLINGLRLIEAANLSDMIDIISELNINEVDNLRLITIDGIEVLLGTSENPVYQMLTLREVLVNLYSMEKRDVIIDVRYEGHVTVKERNIQEEEQ